MPDIVAVVIENPEQPIKAILAPSTETVAAVVLDGRGISGYSGFSGGGGGGESGFSGYSGYSGSGISGYSGYSGVGLSGYSGYSGQDGGATSSGFSGYCGLSGYSGFCGISGYSGYSGSGISGYSGYSGSGISGYSGFCGASGYSGFSGANPGASGYSGFCGLSGYSGFCGLSGYSGFCGLSGYSGFSAASPGASGYSGFSGVSGYSGYSGPSGYSGYSGISGYSGFSAASPGDSGYSGFCGVSGYSGFCGTSGYSGSGISGYSGYSGSGGGFARLSYTQNVPLNFVVGTIVSKAGTVTGTAGVGSSLFLNRLVLNASMNLSEIQVAMSIGFPVTSQGAGTMSRSMVVYSFGNSTSLASVASISGTSAWNTGTSTAGASTSLTQFQGGWSTPLIQPMTFVSTAIPAGEYVVGQLFNFAQASSTWTLAFYGASDPVNAFTSVSAVSNTAAALAIVLSNQGFITGSVVTAITQNATNNVSWFVSRATSAVTSVASNVSAFTFLEAPFVGSLGMATGSVITSKIGVSVLDMAQAVFATGSIVSASTALPNFGFIGSGSTTSGFPTAFVAGIMSTGGIPTAITLTSTAVTFSGSVAFQQPWFALAGA